MHNEFDDNNLPIPISEPFDISFQRANELLALFISHVLHNALCPSCGEVMSITLLKVTLTDINRYCKTDAEREYICTVMGKSYIDNYWDSAKQYISDTETDTMLNIFSYLNERRQIKISPAQ